MNIKIKNLIDLKQYSKNNKFIKINYDKSLSNYNKELVTKLRDFGDNLLDLWVPEEDVLHSLLGLVYSVTQNNHRKIQLLIKTETFEKYHKQFKNIFEKFSEVSILETKKNYEIKINVNNIKKLNEINNSYFSEKKVKKIKSITSIKINVKNEKLVLEDLFKFPSNVLKDKNLFFIKKSQLQYYLSDKNYIHGKEKNLYFFLKLSGNNIISIKFYSQPELLKILINFSKLIINMPLIEAYEHGVMKLENTFRKKNISKKIKGIVTPYILKNVFPNLQNLMNKIYSDYLIQNNEIDKKNLYDLALTDRWNNLSYNRKSKLIIDLINNYCNKSDINLKFVEIEDDVKVLIDISEEKNTGAKKYSFLLNLEKEIRNKLDRRLEVFYKDEPDNNKLRQKNLNEKN